MYMRKIKHVEEKKNHKQMKKLTMEERHMRQITVSFKRQKRAIREYENG